MHAGTNLTALLHCCMISLKEQTGQATRPACCIQPCSHMLDLLHLSSEHDTHGMLCVAMCAAKYLPLAPCPMPT